MHPGDRIEIVHDSEHPVDPNACVVRTIDGEILGYVPAAVAARLVTERSEERWDGTVTEVLVHDTVSLRIKIGEGPVSHLPPVVSDAAEADAAAVGGGFGFDDPITEFAGGIPSTDSPSTSDNSMPSPEQVERALPENDESRPGVGVDEHPGAAVSSKSGRFLGTLAGEAGGKVQVRKADGSIVEFPPALVKIAATTPA